MAQASVTIWQRGDDYRLVRMVERRDVEEITHVYDMDTAEYLDDWADADLERIGDEVFDVADEWDGETMTGEDLSNEGWREIARG